MIALTLITMLFVLQRLPNSPQVPAGVVQGAAAQRVQTDVVVLARFPAFAPRIRVTPPDPATAPRTSARAIGVWDPSTRQFLYSVNADGAMQLASITKLMTALVALKAQVPLDGAITMEAETNGTPGSRLRVPTGAVLSVRDVLFAALIGSGNNATRALVRATGLTEPQFVERMNEEARGLGMTRTHFADVTGLAPGNVSTVRDLVRLTNAAFAEPLIRDATSRHAVTVSDLANSRRYTVTSTDELLGSGLRVVAGKTGFTESSGGNFVSRILGIGERELVFFVLGSKDQRSRFADTRALADWVFAETQWRE